MTELHDVLVVDDDERLARRLAEAFADRGFPARHAFGRAAALAAARERPVDLVILDLRVGEDDGLEILTSLKTLTPEARIILLTGYGSLPVAVEAAKRGAAAVVQKPTDVDGLLSALARAEGRETDVPADYLAPSLARAEWEHIQRVLDDCAGNISEAARRLGLHRRTLQRKLSKYPPTQ
jgi:two-component system response regulator RegA